MSDAIRREDGLRHEPHAGEKGHDVKTSHTRLAEIFKSAVRSNGDAAGVFERLGGTSYFYLYDLRPTDGPEILEALSVTSCSTRWVARHMSVRWSADEKIVGLFIRGELCAAYDLKREEKYCDGLRSRAPRIPARVRAAKW